ncbi:MAG: hypothetical protein KDE25_02795 [Novosphingobium sp.]|nr:hypothetical protein [Novosphingobium sp.]
MDAQFYIGLKEAREVLRGIGIELNERQMKRAAEPGANGKRKLPFFRDPIDGRLKINKHTLLKIYLNEEIKAENAMTFDL